MTLCNSAIGEIAACMQRLLEGAQDGSIHKIRARVQGPFGGHNLPVPEMDEPQHMVVFVGGVGAPTVLSILKRLAIHRDTFHRFSRAPRACICEMG